MFAALRHFLGLGVSLAPRCQNRWINPQRNAHQDLVASILGDSAQIAVTNWQICSPQPEHVGLMLACGATERH
jgi:hypothetical protein